MATAKIIIRPSYKKKDKTVPIAIRITKDRKSCFIFTGKYILEKDWNSGESKVKKSHPNSKRLNNYLLKKLSDANNIVLELTTNDENISVKQIQKKIKRNGKIISFFQVAAKRVKTKYDEETFSVARTELSLLYNIQEFTFFREKGSKQSIIKGISERRKTRHLKGMDVKYTIIKGINAFSKNKSLYFSDIDTAFINKFKTFCSLYLNHSNRTITNHLIFIRTLYNVAIKEGVASQKYYPFSGNKEKIKIHASNKIGLNKSEINSIENLSLEKNSSIWHTQNVWLFTFYLAGIRISDALTTKWSDFIDNRFYYVMSKNQKPVSLKIPKKILKILELYKDDKDSKDDYVFPFLKKANPKIPEDIFIKSRNATSLLNKYLKRIAKKCNIDKNLSNHIARHSFGNIAGDRIHPLMLQKLYRHTDLKTTIGYQANFIHKEVDEALDKVIDF